LGTLKNDRNNSAMATTGKVVDLSIYRPVGFDRGASRLKEAIWLLVQLLLFRLCPFGLYAIKRFVLRLFGARIGRGVVIKPQTKITFPWKLSIGDHVWLGEECWLLNLERLTIGNNVCVSQRAFLCAGSHDYRRSTFDLIVKPIVLEDGVWIGANAWVGPGVTVGRSAVLSASSVALQDLEPDGIYRGNPAQFIKKRTFGTEGFIPDNAKQEKAGFGRR
jgi:putative colanic acid biosynthesis acetyltransferase WcaF